MRPAILVLGVLTLALLAPEASALTLPVGDSVQQTRDLGTITSITWSYNFDPTTFNLQDGTQPNGIHNMAQQVTYDVGSAPGGFWTATIGGTWLGNVFHVQQAPIRSYQTSIRWNGSAWLNMTTTFTLGGGERTSPYAWQVCNHVDYNSGGTNYGATKECDRKYWGGNPTRLQHTAKFGNITMNGQNLTGWRVTFVGAHVQDQVFTSLDLLVPTTNAPTWTTTASASATSVAGDLAHVTVDYLVETNANYAQIEAGAVKATCDGFDCLAIKAADAVFGVMDHVLVLIFDRVGTSDAQGHAIAGRAADGITTFASILIGIPTTLTALFLLHPGKSFIALSDMLLMLGIVRYGSSPMTDISVIWTTVLKFWAGVGRGIVAFATWMWGLAERLFQALLDASPITLMIIGGIVLGSAIGALIVHLTGG